METNGINLENLLVSICIPSYNRPKEIRRLLDSIDAKKYAYRLEIVICEDNAPKRTEVRQEVEEFSKKTNYNVNYIENDINKGYDKNLRELINNAQGNFILFMGDDDLFVPNALDNYLNFIEDHSNCGYILRSYTNKYSDGTSENFRYYSREQIFEPSEQTYINLFDKSVFISGFTIRREYAKQFETDRFDGSLLYQLYLLAEVCRIHPSANCNILIAQAIEGGVPYFGNSESEKKLYTPGTITVQNSINFMMWYMTIIDYMSEKYQTNSADKIRLNMSKYIYPTLAIQREKGRRVFRDYARQLKKIGLAKSRLFYVYYWGLWCFGKKTCDCIIKKLKAIIGRRPNL